MVEVTSKRPRKPKAAPEDHEREKLGNLLVEMDALHTLLRMVDQGGSSDEALALTQQAFGQLLPANSAEERVISRAMAKILAQPTTVSPKSPVKAPRERHVFESVARAWICWADDPPSEVPLQEIPRLRAQKRGACKQTGAIHLLALYFWAAAVEALAKGERAEAHRLWQRAIELGSSVGTPSNAAILWSYAASFFPEVTPRARGVESRERSE